MPLKDRSNPEQKAPIAKKTDAEKNKINRPIFYVFSVIILVVITVTFIGLPVARNQGNVGQLEFGKYEGKPIAYSQGNYFSQQVAQLNEQLRSSGENENFQFQAYRIWKGAYDRTVIHTAILSMAEKSGVLITDDRVDRELAQYPAFLENGQFSPAKYNSMSNSEKYQLRKRVRESLLQQQFTEDVFYGQQQSSKEKAFVTEMSRSERSFAFASFAFDDYPEDQVRAYGKEQEKLFRKVKLSRITVKSSESDAKNILQQLRGKTASFEDLAKTHSKDAFADKGGDMGFRYYYDLQTDFTDKGNLDALFELKKDDISDVYKTDFGWVIYRCDENPSLPDFSNKETVELIRTYMKRYERGRIEDFLLNKAKQFREKALTAGFVLACTEFNTPVSTTEYFPINYANINFFKPVKSQTNAQALARAAYEEAFFLQAFKLKKDEVSQPIISGDYVIVLQLGAERKADDNSVQMLESYFPYIVQSLLDAEFQRVVLDSPSFKDNFDKVFAETFLKQ